MDSGPQDSKPYLLGQLCVVWGARVPVADRHPRLSAFGDARKGRAIHRDPSSETGWTAGQSDKPMVNALSTLGDEALADEARRDPAAFAPLYERYQPEILRFVTSRVSDAHLAEDITSQVFLRAMRAMPTYQAGSFRGWLYQIARNAVVDSYRRHRADVGGNLLAGVADASPGPLATVEALEAREELARVLGQLTDIQRQVISLRLGGASGQEIADALGMSLGAVKSAQFRAFERIRMLMREPEPGNGRTWQ